MAQISKTLKEDGAAGGGAGAAGATASATTASATPASSGTISISDIQQPVEPGAFVSSTSAVVKKLKKKGWKPVVLNPKTGKYEVQG